MAWCQEYRITNFIETSAKTSQNVSTAFIMAVQQWKKLEQSAESLLRAQGDTIDLTRSVQLNRNGKSSCCNGSTNNPPCRSTEHEVLQ